MLDALGGDPLVIVATASADVVDLLCDDLGRLGPVDLRVAEPVERASMLDDEQWQLLGMLIAGASLGDAARALHVGRRTADRRLAAARAALGASTTAHALVLARRAGVPPITFP